MKAKRRNRLIVAMTMALIIVAGLGSRSNFALAAGPR